MFGAQSIWTNIASVIIACVGLGSMGVLFVRATNIERRWLVSATTLVFSALALYLLVEDTMFVPGREIPTGIAAITISILGFFIGRAIDAGLGAREYQGDPGTYYADLAD